jgi:PilZ domain-containing protein
LSSVGEIRVLTEAKSRFQANLGTGADHARATVRVNSRVPIAIEWTEGGQTLRAEGVTMDVSVKGCMAVVPQGFAVGQKLRVVNKVNAQTCDAVLIWRGHEGRTGWELGLELQAPPAEFWGVEF